MLKIESTVLVVVDVQGKLANLMYGRQALFENLQKAIKGIQVLEIPILWVEQNPEGLGPTIPEITDLLIDIEPIGKISFSSCRNELFIQALKAADCNQVLIVGIETHICVYQTAMDLVDSGYEVHIVTDAVSSRTQDNKQVALQKMKDSGVNLTSTEMALFELLGAAEGKKFMQILKIVK